MATVGKPAITDPRTGDLRELQQLVARIRERFQALEAALSGAAAAPASSSSAAAVSSSAAALAQSFNSISPGLLVKLAANTMAARTLSLPVEFDVTNANGVGGDPTVDWATQGPGLVLGTSLDYAGRPEFRPLELAGTYDIDILGFAGKMAPAPVPPSSLTDGEEGQFAWDDDYVYLCLGPYTWRRAALSTF